MGNHRDSPFLFDKKNKKSTYHFLFCIKCIHLHIETNKNTRTMTKFKIGETYRGTSGVGHIAIVVIKRTEKTITVKTSFGENRIKIRNWSEDKESALFKSWAFDADDQYSDEQAEYDTYYAAYHS